jgi:hypothetical protein
VPPASLRLSGPGGARPDDICPQQRPAGLKGSGVVAVVDPASSHATASVAAVQQAVSTHPGIGVRDPAVQPSGVRSPGLVVQRSGAGPSAVQPWVRTCPSPPMLRRWRWGPGRAGRATLTTGTGGGPGGYQASTARSMVAEAGTRATLPNSRWSGGGGWRTRAAGVGGGPQRPRLPAERPGRPGRRGGRPSRAAARWAREQAAARAGGTGRVAGVLGLGARPRWVVVAEADARGGGPGGVRGGAGGDGRAAPARPKPAASAPGSLPAAL